jgi:hypothetical protein|tara:strand:+ start:12107 stop:12391 length:285 start_codon:yes stop_codon:yes gene_type:complete
MEEKMQLTHHARVRSAQRSIPLSIIETILDYGDPKPASGRALRILFDTASIRLAAEGNRRLQSELERYRNTYLIVGDSDSIITVARSRRRHFDN